MIGKLTLPQMLSTEERVHPYRSDSAEKEVAQNDVRELGMFCN